MDKSALNRATDPTSAPTPGYLYNDIARSLLSPQACTDTLKFLSNKLSKNNPHVKKKALKVLTKAASHPSTRGRFKRCVVQDPQTISLIKECTAYRGTMDAVTGDQWNVEVREAAKECLDVIYSDDGGDQVGGHGMTGLGASGGAFGSSGFGGGGYGAPMGGQPGSGMGGGGAPSKYEGIGNPMYKDPRMGEVSPGGLANMTVTEVMGNVGIAMMEMIKDPLAKNVTPGTGSPVRAGYGGPQMRPDPYTSNPPGRNKLATQTGGQWTMASNRGPNAIGSTTTTNVVSSLSVSQQNSEYYKAANAAGSAFQWAGGAATPAPTPGVPNAATSPRVGAVGGSWGGITAPAPPQPQMSVAARSRAEANGTLPSTPSIPTGPATSNGVYERNLIAELCPPGGMKAEPPQDKLQEFARAVPSLDPDCVCPALLDALEEGNPWIMRAKALCVIETVLKVMAQVEGGNAYADFFHACSAEIAPLANHARAAVKAPARRVLTLLGLGEGVGEMANGDASDGVAAAAEPVTEAPNLLDFDEPAPPTVAALVAPPPPPVQAAQPAVSSGGDSLFSGLNTKAAAPLPVPTPPVSSTMAQDDDLLGGFGDIAPTVAAPVMAPAPAAPSNDLFGDMGVKSIENGVTNAPHQRSCSLPAGSGSAFGFLNTTVPLAPPTETPATPSTPAPQTFDPLLSLGAPGSSNPPSSTPNPDRMAQMQVTMAYQQQMMMMQQQMQMAYGGAGGNNFVRQGSGGAVPRMPMMGNPRQTVMGANYMRQVPGVQGDKMTSFSFLGADPKKQQNNSFDFVKDAMKKG